MRCLSVSVGIIATLVAGTGAAQSLCNPCVDPPVTRANFGPGGNSPTVISADEMRELGVVTVADMVNQILGDLAEKNPETGDESSAKSAAEETAVEDADSSDSDSSE